MWEAARKRKSPSSTHGDERQALRGTTRIRTCKMCALSPPITAGPPSPSQGPLPGEPSDTIQAGSQPVTRPLLGPQTRYFPVQRTVITTYITKNRHWQGGKRGKDREIPGGAPVPAGRCGRCRRPRPSAEGAGPLVIMAKPFDGDGLLFLTIVKITKNPREKSAYQVGFSSNSCEKCRILKIPSKFHCFTKNLHL